MSTTAKKILTDCALFGGLHADCVGHLAEHATEILLEAGDILYNEGDSASALFVVVSGSLEVFKPSMSGEHILNNLSSGEFFGDMSFIDMQARSATVRAPEKSQLCQIDYAVLRDVYQNDIKCSTLIVMNIAREMSRRLRRSDKKR